MWLDGADNLPDAVWEYERKWIKEALRAARNKRTEAAKLLGISHQQLSALLQGRHKDLNIPTKALRKDKGKSKL